MSTSWRQIQRKTFTDRAKLAEFLEIPLEKITERKQFPLMMPYRLAEKVEKGNLNDPVLLQFLPIHAENQQSPSFLCDPVGDEASRKTAKLLHKYKGRVLIICSSACAMHCRYCFRQNFSYELQGGFAEEIAYIQNDPSVEEVILSGGDPLSLSNEVLSELLSELQVKRIRFHTRFPIGIPERIDEDFLSMLRSLKPQVYFVLHCNHPHELDEDIFAACDKIRQTGAVILNQAVLLRGVNDDLETQKELCLRLADRGILPYYLHQLDRVQGAMHFEVEESRGLQLIEQLQTELSGYAVPKYVREIAGEKSKSPIELHSLNSFDAEKM